MSDAFFLNTMKHIALLLIAALTLVSCHHDPLVTLQGETQGSYYTIRYYDQQQRNLTPQIDSILTLVDNTLSLWNENSLIRRINNGTDSLISPLFHDLLTKANTMRLYTNGALDCRIGTLVKLYGFGFEKRTEITQQQIDTILSQLSRQTYLIADSNLSLPSPTYTLRRLEPFEFDFNAIAQGYTSDLIGHLFDSLGISNYIINIGGEVLAKGTKENGENWSVGIERPATHFYDTVQNIETIIYLHDKSVVTSGNYRKYYEKDGIRYSHTINPATGRPVDHSLLSVSVISDHAWYADAMATAFMVMGLEQSLQFINSHPENPDIQAVYFIYNENGEYRTHSTPAFDSIIQK